MILRQVKFSIDFGMAPRSGRGVEVETGSVVASGPTVTGSKNLATRLPWTKLWLTLLLACACRDVGHARDREQQRAKTMLETLCGRCHAIGTTGESPLINAPPFRTFGEDKLYDNDFGQRLQDGLTTIHRDMPTFRFSKRDAEAAVNYLRSIQDHKKSGR